MSRRFDNSFGVGFTYQVVFTKFEGPDAHPRSAKSINLAKQVQELVPTALPPIFTSAHMNLGIEDVQKAIGDACGLKEKTAYKEEMKLFQSMFTEEDDGADDGIEYYHVPPRGEQREDAGATRPRKSTRR
jgi:GTP-binding protein